MRNLFLITSILFCSIASAQTDKIDSNEDIQTIFGKIKSHGAYGALNTSFTQLHIADGVYRNAIQIGGRGMWVANHKLAVGFGGNGIISSSFNNSYYLTRTFFNAGYGGLIIEPIFFSKKIAHVTIPILVGGGGATIRDGYNRMHNNVSESVYEFEMDQFFIFEPGIEIELNILKNLRLAFAFSYRLASSIDLSGVNKNALNGAAGGVTLKLGVF